jgi:uncharacterized protein
MLVAALVLTGLSLLVHRYLWARLVRAASWPAPWGTALTVAFVTLAVLVPAAFLAMRFLPRSLNGPIGWVAYTWMGFLLYLFLLTVLTDLGRGVAAVIGALPKDPERRLLLSRLIASGVAGAAGLIGIGGLVTVARGFRVARVRVPLAKLPKSASGYVIVQMTDVHVGPTLGRDFIETIVRQTNALEPDMIVITGDLVDGSVEQLREHVAPLRDLKAKDGVFFVTGNHEYYSGVDEWLVELERLGVRTLRNERVSIGDGEHSFDLAGVDDMSAHRYGHGHGADLGRALEGRDATRELVLLAHQPKQVLEAEGHGVGLQLSGHTHGGQIFPWGFFVRLDQPFVAGLGKQGETQIYVSRGTGFWGPPMRVAAPPEISVVELVTA